jgi:hypothetical protein
VCCKAFLTYTSLGDPQFSIDKPCPASNTEFLLKRGSIIPFLLFVVLEAQYANSC